MAASPLRFHSNGIVKDPKRLRISAARHFIDQALLKAWKEIDADFDRWIHGRRNTEIRGSHFEAYWGSREPATPHETSIRFTGKESLRFQEFLRDSFRNEFASCLLRHWTQCQII